MKKQCTACKQYEAHNPGMMVSWCSNPRCVHYQKPAKVKPK